MTPPRKGARPSPPPATDPSFDEELFTFLDDLRANNDKAWFTVNRARYERVVLEPALAFIEDFAPRLEAISHHFRADARASGGSLFRIHRDTRFSKDKTPYKTNIGIHFRHNAAKDAHAPGFYLHLEPGACFFGCGIWRPDGTTTQRIREAIVEDPDGWTGVTRAQAFAGRLELSGDQLKRPPAGLDPAHPLIDDLRRKDFIALAPVAQSRACAPELIDDYDELCRLASPLARFLCRALELAF